MHICFIYAYMFYNMFYNVRLTHVLGTVNVRCTFCHVNVDIIKL